MHQISVQQAVWLFLKSISPNLSTFMNGKNLLWRAALSLRTYQHVLEIFMLSSRNLALTREVAHIPWGYGLDKVVPSTYKCHVYGRRYEVLSNKEIICMTRRSSHLQGVKVQTGSYLFSGNMLGRKGGIPLSYTTPRITLYYVSARFSSKTLQKKMLVLLWMINL